MDDLTPEPGELEHGPQHHTHQDCDPDGPQCGLRVGLSEAHEVLDRGLGDDALRLPAAPAEVQLCDALQIQHHAD